MPSPSRNASPSAVPAGGGTATAGDARDRVPAGVPGVAPLRAATTIPLALVAEGDRMMRICNACRYCEGFCPVFPAVERRLAFAGPDLAYLANLCHDCRECYYSCQYAPPHAFDVNVPQLLARVRRETYRRYAWPGAFTSLFERGGATLLVAVVVAPLLVLSALAAANGPARLLGARADAPGDFYDVMPHAAMVGVFGLLALVALAAFAGGFVRFWRDTARPADPPVNREALRRATADALALRHLGGGGEGCAYPHERASQARRWFHHLTFYGFVLCFAATSVAAFYHHVLGSEAPYPLLSLPVALGCAGGAGLLVGPLGLLWLKWLRDPAPGDPAQGGMDVAFLLLLFLTSVTGFVLLVVRETAAMGVALAVHLGVVAGLFATWPYGKFVHAVYRYGALLRYAQETQHPARPQDERF